MLREVRYIQIKCLFQMADLRKVFKMDNNEIGGGGNDGVGNLSAKVITGGRNVVLKVTRDDDFAIRSNMNRCLKYSTFTLSYLFPLFSIGLFTLSIWAQMAKSGKLVNLKKFDSKKYYSFLTANMLPLSLS